VGVFGYCHANSYATIDQSEEGDDLCLFLVYCHIAYHHKTIFNRKFFVEKVLANFNKEQVQNRSKKRSRATFFHLENVTPYRIPRNFDRLGITKFPHQLYSLEIARSC
jgi:hypothetical protein